MLSKFLYHAHIGQNAAFSELDGTSQKFLTECGNFTVAEGIVSSDSVRIISGQKWKPQSGKSW